MPHLCGLPNDCSTAEECITHVNDMLYWVTKRSMPSFPAQRVWLGAAGYTVSTWSRSHETKNKVKGVPHIAGKTELFEKLPAVDIVVCLLPLTHETIRLINSDFLSRMKCGSALLNAGRGEHVVEEDLLDSLETGETCPLKIAKSQ